MHSVSLVSKLATAKSNFSKLVVAMVGLTLASSFSMAGTVEIADDITYRGTSSLTKLTVVHDGVEKTYSVSPKIAGEMELSFNNTNLSFGVVSRCAPYLGDVARETRIDAVITAASKNDSPDKMIASKMGPTTLVIPAGTPAYGVCGGKDVTELTELLIQTREKSITFDK